MSGEFSQLKTQDLGGLVDEARLAAWLDGIGIAPGAPLALERISGGLSNECIAVERGGAQWVLRRPAARALADAERSMRREFRVLSALEGSAVPHPRPVALCEDPEVAGGVAYLMERVAGFAPGLELPEPFAGDAGLRRGIALEAVSALGALARVDWRACGLDDFGRPEGFHRRQVERWGGQLAGYASCDGRAVDEHELSALDQRDLSALEEVGGWLERNCPGDEQWSPGIMHGDYHLANVLVAPSPPPRIAAILDWENATIGDPLLDLATFLRVLESRGHGDWAARDALIQRWEEASGRRAPELRYWTALATFKQAIMLEGVYRRSLEDPTRSGAETLGETALRLAREARDRIRA